MDISEFTEYYIHDSELEFLHFFEGFDSAPRTLKKVAS